MLLADILCICVAVVNAVAFAAYGIDKWKARHGAWRIPESVLLTLAALGGALGACMGMFCFRHKTQHAKFLILNPLLLVVEGLGAWWLLAKYDYLLL